MPLSSFVGLGFFDFLVKLLYYRDLILFAKSYLITSFTCSQIRRIAVSEVCLKLGSGCLLQSAEGHVSLGAVPRYNLLVIKLV